MVGRGEGKKRRRIINEAANLVASGMSDDEVRRHIMDVHDRSRLTADRYLSVVHAEQARRISKQRPVLVARQSAKLDNAQRKALSHQRQVIGPGGQPVELRDPDLGVFVRAVEAQNRLLGLNAPEQMQVLVANANALVRDVADLIGEFLPDIGQRRAFLEQLRRRAEDRVREKPKLINSPPPSFRSGEEVEIAALPRERELRDDETADQ